MPLPPSLVLGWAAGYTFKMCAWAMGEVARGAPAGRVRELTGQWAIGLPERAGVEVRAFGADELDLSTPRILMANHQSYLDVLALYRALPTSFGFIAKKQLFSVPLFGGVMRELGCVPVDRENRAEAMGALDEAAAQVRGGASIAVFPEGTRSPGDRIAALKKGPFYLAQRAGVPIVPIGIRGTGRLMPRQNTQIRSGVVEVHVGAPIPAIAPEGTEPRQALMNQVRLELSRLAGLPIVD